MTLPKFALDYAACTEEELQRFIKDRTGQPPPSECTKEQCIENLTQLDRNATFRFLDLIPELRQVVYEELLFPVKMRFAAGSCGRQRLYAQILAASKQI
jgi:hypothetical protein